MLVFWTEFRTLTSASAAVKHAAALIEFQVDALVVNKLSVADGLRKVPMLQVQPDVIKQLVKCRASTVTIRYNLLNSL